MIPAPNLLQKILLLIFLLFTGTSLLQCRKEKADLDMNLLFQQTEDAVQNYYIYKPSDPDPEVPRFTMEDLYSQAMKAVDPVAETKVTASRKALVDLLSLYNGSERKEKIYSALEAFLKALPAGINDIVRPESMDLLNDSTRTAGVGLVILKERSGRYFILDSLEGSPAALTGVKTGVYLQSVDGISTKVMNDLEEVVGRIRGPAESSVTLEAGNEIFRLKRGNIPFPNLKSSTWFKSTSHPVEYVLLRSTLPGTAEQVRQMLLSLDRRSAIVLDLRKLHTGDFEESFRVADQFLEKGKMGSLETRASGVREFHSDADQLYAGKIILILGRYSSPFAETIAMALQSIPVTSVVGTTPAQKTFVSRSIPVEGGITLRIVTGTIKRPDGTALYRNRVAIQYSVKDIVPEGLPDKKPDPEDPAQKQAASLVRP